ncbi:MAG: aryl-sulfate sulfotransferase, partial [Myxococcota bacterium]
MAIGGLLVLVACTETSGPADVGVVATLTPAPAIGTVADVHVEAPDGADVTIEVAEAGGPTRRFVATPAEHGGYDALLAGLAADVAYTWRAVASFPDGEVRTADEVFHTAPQPAWAPLLAVEPPVDPWAPGFVGSTLLGADAAYVVLDAQGRYVWWWRPDEAYMVNNARLARGGRSVLVLLADADMREDLGTLVEVGLDGEVIAETAAPGAHHDFVETPDGGIVYLAFDTRPWDGEDTIGDRLARLERTTGVTETLWSSWDALSPTRPDAPDIYSFGRDWTHANGLALDPVSGDWLVSLHNLDAVVRIAWDGALRWQMGGAGSDLAVVGDEGFAFQHSPSFGAEDEVL